MIKSIALHGVNERIEEVLKITNNYNYEDLVKAIFCINININNRSALSCQMTLNLSLMEYEEYGNLRIRDYSEFMEFFEKIKSVLQIEGFDDYIVEDFGEVKYKYKDQYYKVIMGTGYNLVYGQLFFLDCLAQKMKKEEELEIVLKYNSDIIEFFEKINKSNEKREIKFEIPSEILFDKTQEFFNTKCKEFNFDILSKLFDNKDAPIEKRYFVKKYNNVYPLYNTAILIDLFSIWYKSVNQEIKQLIVDLTLNKIISDITILDQGRNPNVLYPVSLFQNGKNVSKYIYSFFMKCKKGAIIGINKEQFENDEEMHKELELIKQYHRQNKLNMVEMVKRNENKYNLGVTVAKECDLHFIIYDDFIDISEIYMKLEEIDKEYYMCSALDLVYMLLFMDDQDELLKYISEKNEGDYDQIFGFGGDSSKFLTWKDSGYMLVQGALQYGIIDIGYNVENDYVIDYFKKTLKEFPFDCNEEFLLNSPFAWKITKDDNGNNQYVNKIKKNFGGILFNFRNGAAAFFVHNMEFYEKESFKNEYFDIIRLVDELNSRKIKKVKSVIEESEKFKNKLIEVIFMPNKYGISAGISRKTESKYVYSDFYNEKNVINIRYMINYELLRSDIMNAKNRIIENIFFKELFKPLERLYKEEYEKICQRLDEENKLKKEVDVFTIEIDYIYNMSLYSYNVQELDYLNAKKEISKICLESNIEPGEYFGKEANKVIRSMQKQLIEYFEKQIKQFDRLDLHKKLLELSANAYHNININKKRFKSFNNVDEGVLNEVQLKTIKNREQSKHNLRTIFYLIESNLFLQRDTEKDISYEELNKLLAFSNWLVVLSDNADICYFTDKEAHINVNFDYTIDILVEEENTKKTDDFSMRVYSNNDYSIKGDKEDLEFAERAKKAFFKDTSIELINLFDICYFIQRYAVEELECIKYSDNVYSIKEFNLIKKIQNYMKNTGNKLICENVIKKSLDFITLDVSKLKTIGGKSDYYLPIGKRKERNNRFDIRPIINENGTLYFSPALVSYVYEHWKNGLLDNYLPYEIGLENTVAVMQEWKKKYEKEMVFDIKKIFVDNDISYVNTNVELYKIDKVTGHPRDLGDYDVLAIDDSNLKIWIIESKVLKKVGSFFEMFQQQIGFFENHKDDEDFQRRIDYMKVNYKKILKALKFDSSNNYEIIPYMVVNKVMSSRYKKIDFPIISIGELEGKLKNRDY